MKILRQGCPKQVNGISYRRRSMTRGHNTYMAAQKCRVPGYMQKKAKRGFCGCHMCHCEFEVAVGRRELDHDKRQLKPSGKKNNLIIMLVTFVG